MSYERERLTITNFLQDQNFFDLEDFAGFCFLVFGLFNFGAGVFFFALFFPFRFTDSFLAVDFLL